MKYIGYVNCNCNKDENASSCEHKDKRIAYDYFDVYEAESFKGFIDKLGGADNFPVMFLHLPQSAEGVLPAMLAEEALKELELLDIGPDYQKLVQLKEKSTGKILTGIDALDNGHSAPYSWIQFSPDDKNGCGIDENGFFISEKRKGLHHNVFRSKNFLQKTVTRSPCKIINTMLAEHCRFTDIPTGNYIECKIKLRPFEKDTVAEIEFIITAEDVAHISEYTNIIAKLRKLATESAQIGNPIVWEQNE